MPMPKSPGHAGLKLAAESKQPVRRSRAELHTTKPDPIRLFLTVAWRLGVPLLHHDEDFTRALKLPEFIGQRV